MGMFIHADEDEVYDDSSMFMSNWDDSDNNSWKFKNEEEFDDLVEKWHNSDSELTLHEFLGMTWSEYQNYLKP